jgi:5-methylcytosine-specific restriction protein B
MRNKVIPLLQEYFYDDWEKIRLVLNDGFIERNTQDASKLFEAIEDEYIEDDKYVYSIASSFSLESYIKIYAKIEQNQTGE